MVFALTLAYRGTAYAGWQRQHNALAVQAVVEEAVGEVLGHAVSLVAAGRTDAGVHARGQVAHLETERDFPARGLVHATNRLLPSDIRVLRAARMADGFHARKLASAKAYRYRMVRAEVLSPLDALFAVRVPLDIDVAAMERAARRLVGRHDVSAFALAGGSHRSPVRTIESAGWVESGEAITFEIVGDGFLRGMVRGVVGTLIEIGTGRREAESVSTLLEGAPRGDAGPTAPPEGLVLHAVRYPEAWRPIALE